MTHLLVTNDFPPKAGGIQNYLYELWSRLDPDRFSVLTHADPNARGFDGHQRFAIERTRDRMLLPTPVLAKRIRATVSTSRMPLVVLDPALPVGALGPKLGVPYALVLHGAEVTVPRRLPATAALLRRTIDGAALIIAAGDYPLGQANASASHLPEHVVVPPGVDTARFHPIDEAARREVRQRFGLPEEAPLVLSFSRLVPRKGMDVLIEAAARLRSSHPDLVVAIGGTGRDHKRLGELIAKHGAPVRLLGRIEEEDLPTLTASADLFVMLCRDRWLGLEQEGFGIVFLEAAACGVAQVAGRSGGSSDAVVDGSTGLVVDRPGDVVVATEVIRRLLDDTELRKRLGEQARQRAVEHFDYDKLVVPLAEQLARFGG